ncbi:small GTP-binding protein domain-containing protein [Gracilibacillus ureilyticus]|uniref:Small GTP-binding protein domain-containing protein n=1 Tax=Gracilibacillus ureilyticus TaxID=531814 RepID=A0A1H9LFT9_9BACI|nr:dynamin family protein [Gracilibacillus ureilyticus]SER09793.1 small GTP-binding protein domain-containing protein [Gracilibacillus ureilyticus]
METTTLKAVSVEQIAALYSRFGTFNELDRQQKLLDFFRKKQEEMKHICFCGHFSAGKSTLLNQLLNQPLLPQSPIPTSANIVEIKNGPDEYVIHFKKGEPVRLDGKTAIEDIHALCRDGEEIKKVEIFKETDELVKGVTLMDTPGIDAADDADRLMTESALHVVDLLFYVIDYNHVQSEVNASFLKKLDEMNKPYIVIINQIDKHDESEISFADFKQSLHTVFDQWGISPLSVYYTSLAGDSNPQLNQWLSLKERVRRQIQSDSEIMIDETLFNGIHQLVKDFIEEKQSDMDRAITSLEEKINEINIDQSVDFESLKVEKISIEKEKSEIEATYQKLLDQTLKNAQLMPFEIRENARELLEAYAPGFKVGFFNSRQKTADERKQRLETFYQALHQQVEVNLEWKLKDKLTEFIEGYTTLTFEENLFENEISKETITQLMNDNVKVTGDYVLVYTDLVANHVKKFYRQYFKDKWHSAKTEIFHSLENQLKKIESQLEKFEQNLNYEQQIDEHKQSFLHYKNQLVSVLEGEWENPPSITHLQEKINNLQKIPKSSLDEWKKNTIALEPDQSVNREKEVFRYNIDQTFNDATRVLSLVEKIPALSKFHKGIGDKMDRLKNRHFTIALFGAFSAGKSSFANALIGEDILPVSPNPTTAAINKISPPTDEYKHEEIKVTLKQERELLDDFHAIIENKTFISLKDAVKWLRKLNIHKLTVPDQHKTFLFALLNGYEKMADNIGTTYKIGMDQFSTYIQNEHVACFVREMELHYHCPLTEQNVTLVDTPGADSVNARHTELSFSYIKNADAVLFVTYYNHPFSRPDKTFLEKLGSVKDAFQLDKMFFIVNAVDLAKDETEVQMVLDYVKRQLQTFDIQQPRMFPVSSKMALQEKLTGSQPILSGLDSFEQSFYEFIKEDLTQLSMQSIYTDINRAHALVKKWLEISRSNQTERDVMMKEINQNEEQMLQLIEKRDNEAHIASVIQLVNKQSFHVVQRFSIQFTDVFRSCINPGAIQNNGKTGKAELDAALNKLHTQTNERVKYELEALYIRVETLWNKEWQQYRGIINNQLKLIDQTFSLSELEDIDLPTPDAGISIEKDDQLMKSFVKNYKDTASFFAKEGRDQLEEEIKEFYNNNLEKLIEEVKLYLTEYYEQQWHTADQHLWNQYSKEVSAFNENIKKGINDNLENEDILIELDNSIEKINAQLV